MGELYFLFTMFHLATNLPLSRLLTTYLCMLNIPLFELSLDTRWLNGEFNFNETEVVQYRLIFDKRVIDGGKYIAKGSI